MNFKHLSWNIIVVLLLVGSVVYAQKEKDQEAGVKLETAAKERIGKLTAEIEQKYGITFVFPTSSEWDVLPGYVDSFEFLSRTIKYLKQQKLPKRFSPIKIEVILVDNSPNHLEFRMRFPEVLTPERFFETCEIVVYSQDPKYSKDLVDFLTFVLPAEGSNDAQALELTAGAVENAIQDVLKKLVGDYGMIIAGKDIVFSPSNLFSWGKPLVEPVWSLLDFFGMKKLLYGLSVLEKKVREEGYKGNSLVWVDELCDDYSHYIFQGDDKDLYLKLFSYYDVPGWIVDLIKRYKVSGVSSQTDSVDLGASFDE